MMSYTSITENLRHWLDARHRAERDRELLQLAREQLLYFEAVGDTQSAEFWLDVIDSVKHPVRF